MTYTAFKQSLLSSVENAESVLITSHQGPDDDSIASTLSLYAYLVEQEDIPKSKLRIAYESRRQDRWNIFTYYDEVTFCKDISKYVEKADTLIVLDANSIDRFTEADIEAPLNPEVFVIDHHEGSGDWADHAVIEETRASCADMIHRLFYEDAELPEHVAKTLLMGILADTGSFRYVSAKNAEVFSTAEDLVRGGDIDIAAFAATYQGTPRKHYEVFAKLHGVARFQEIEGWPPFLYAALPEHLAEQYKDSEISAGAHMFVSHTTRLNEVGWGFVMTPRSTGNVKCSFRSRPGSVDVRYLTTEMDIGGGHVRASGARFEDMTIPEAEEALFTWMEKHDAQIE